MSRVTGYFPFVGSCICPPLPPPPPIPVPAPNPLLVAQTGADFGVDISFLSDLDPNFTLVSGFACLGQDLAHRFETPRGGLFYDGNYGTDIRGRLNEALSPKGQTKLASDIQAECMKDERVLACTARVQLATATSTLTVTISVNTAAGPFQFILGVTSVSVTLLAQSINPS